MGYMVSWGMITILPTPQFLRGNVTFLPDRPRNSISNLLFPPENIARLN